MVREIRQKIGPPVWTGEHRACVSRTTDCEVVISWWHRHCTFVSNWNFRIQFETRRRRDMLFEPGGVSFCDNPPAQPWGTKKAAATAVLLLSRSDDLRDCR